MANLRTDNLCGRGIVSVNDGTVWSSLVSGSTLSGYPATNGFNGNTVNDVYPAAGGTIVWTAPNGGIRGNKIRIHVYAGNTHPIVMVNGVTTGAVVGSSTPDQRGAWVDVTDITGGVLKTITAVGQTIGGIARQSGWGAVEIDGEILVDSLVGSKGGRSAINGSVFFSNESDYLNLGSAGDHNYLHDGTEDYSVEFWIFPTISNDRQTVFSTGGNSSSTGFACRIMEDGASGGSNGYKVLCQFSRGSSGNYLGFLGGTVDINSWSHIALQFTTSNKQLKIYVNGVLTNSSDLDGTANGTFGSGNFSSSNSTYAFTIGKEPYGDTLFLDGAYISNLRICRGHTVYSSEFTPPTSPLTAHYISENDKTTILCCQDSDDPTQEATGKTISAHGGGFQTGNKNILLNGDFSQGTTGFIGDSGASLSESGGVMTVTNGGGDNLYALRQDGSLRDGSTYRCTATVTPTFASGNPVFRVRFGGNAESFVQPQATMSTGVSFRLDTGEKVADGTQFEIGSGNSSGITQFTITDLVVTAINPPTMPKVIPPYGVDAGVTFGGAISMNSSSWMNFPTGRASERGRGRGVIFGGYASPGGGYTQDIYYIDIQSMGNAVHFGDITATRYSGGGCGSSTRGLIGGGRDGSTSNRVNTIEYVEIAITSNSLDFGDLTETKAFNPGGGNQTRGIWMGGSTPSDSDVIEYVTIASKGDAIDFGNLRAASYAPATAASPTRMLAMGGGTPSSFFDYIDYVEIATTGNASDFGDLTQDRNQNTGVSSNTRAVAMGGARSPALSNVMDFVTMSTLGNATDFGDTLGTYEHTGSVNNSIRGVLCGARTPSYINIMESITIATTGNSTDFGDIPRDNLAYVVGASDSHGGLS